MSWIAAVCLAILHEALLETSWRSHLAWFCAFMAGAIIGSMDSGVRPAVSRPDEEEVIAMIERNPNHRVTSALHDHWHKLLAIVLHKHRHDLPRDVVVTAADLNAFEAAGHINIVAHDKPDGLHLLLVDDAEAERLAKREGGLPV